MVEVSGRYVRRPRRSGVHHRPDPRDAARGRCLSPPKRPDGLISRTGDEPVAQRHEQVSGEDVVCRRIVSVAQTLHDTAFFSST